MNYILGELGERVAYEDNIISEAIKNNRFLAELTDFKLLLNFKLHAPPIFHTELDTQLEKRKKDIDNKIKIKEHQCEALLKLLEYINSLETKDKQLESEILLQKIESIEKDINPYKEIFM